jgi:hypothetical protein
MPTDLWTDIVPRIDHLVFFTAADCHASNAIQHATRKAAALQNKTHQQHPTIAKGKYWFHMCTPLVM